MNSILVELFNETLGLVEKVLLRFLDVFTIIFAVILSLGIIIFLVRSYVFIKTHIDGGNRNSFSIAQECFDGTVEA
ncbi:MAG: hypothetical protein QXE05_07990, partial [Nitrososphaeria archaeon]